MNSKKIKPPVEQAVRIPAWLFVRSELSVGAKVLYATMVHLSKGRTWVDASLEYISREMKVSVRTLFRYVQELENVELVSRQKGKHSSKYFFLEHPWMSVIPDIGAIREDPSELFTIAGEMKLSNPFAFVNKMLKTYPFRAVDAGLRDAYASPPDKMNMGRAANFIKNAHQQLDRGADRCPNCGAFAFAREDNTSECPKCKAVFRRNIYAG